MIQQILVLLIVLIGNGESSMAVIMDSKQPYCFSHYAKADSTLFGDVHSYEKSELKSIEIELYDESYKIVNVKKQTQKKDKLFKPFVVKKAQTYQFCITSLNSRYKLYEVNFGSAVQEVDQSQKLLASELPDEQMVGEVLKDVNKNHKNLISLEKDIKIAFDNHLHLQASLDHRIEVIKEYQYYKVYFVIIILIVQSLLLYKMIKEKSHQFYV